MYQNNTNISCFEGLLFSVSQKLIEILGKQVVPEFFISLCLTNLIHSRCVRKNRKLVPIKFCWRTRWTILNNHKVTTTIVIPLRLLCQTAETLHHKDAALWAGILLALCSSFSPEVLSKTIWKLGYGFMWSDSGKNLVSEHSKMV